MSRSTDVVFLCDVDGYRVWRCPSSATDFVWPVPTDDALKRFYDRADWFEGGERGGYASYDAQTAGSLPMVSALLDAAPGGDAPRYVLDVGCGYGTHLALAAERGWKCFGVELSDHARGVAIERHGAAITVVASVEALVPHQFDLVLMLDVLEHVADPYALMFRMFNRGLIGPQTRVAISTPNARSDDAVADPGRWIYRHPPSHLVYYSARSLRRLLDNLLFDDVRVRGTNPLPPRAPARYDDEALAPDEALAGDAGLLCEASGSRFYGFMQERYVPGTWSKLAEYEHLPRYQFSRQFAAGRTVLDFGCGTGYGTRLIADVAARVVGLDIDAAAIAWASMWHGGAGLSFERRDDLGAGLPSASFDLVTCFEMIEHVDHATQIATIRNIARLLKAEGRLVISTPNPAVTAAYGENPYHLREMDEAQFRALLAPSFAHVVVLPQWIRPSVAIGAFDAGRRGNVVADFMPSAQFHGEPAAFVAICSQRPPETPDFFLTLDSSADFVLVELRRQQAETGALLDTHALREASIDSAARERRLLREYELTKRLVDEKDRGLRDQARTLQDAERQRVEKDGLFAEQARQIALLERAIVDGQEVVNAREIEAARLLGEIDERDRKLQAQGSEVARLTGYWVEKEAILPQLHERMQVAETAFAGSLSTIEEIEALRVDLERQRAELAERLEHQRSQAEAERAVLQERIASLQERIASQQAHIVALERSPYERARRFLVRVLRLRPSPAPTPAAPAILPVAPQAAVAAYVVKAPATIRADRPRVLHAIANFMTGGSSRLVVDLVERLGGDYEQRILTSFIPKPAHYVGLDIVERPMGTSRVEIAKDIAAFAPDLVHVHYWGDCDEPWYREVFAAAEERHVPILQNVNTPVLPFTDVRSDHAVFVSEYVQEHFGAAIDSGEVIYPGSDFAHFERRTDLLDNDCVGMVYRLEEDKLNASAIDVFIRIAQARPDVRCLIVGGGTLLEPFRSRVRDAGCEASFEFTGYVAYEELPGLYARMGVFVAPVWKESFGQVSSFAMNMGMPVIGYDIGAIPEIVADPSLVAPPGDAAALAAIAIALLADRPRREAVMRTNQERVAHLFSVEAMIERYRAVYRRLVARAG